MKNLIPLNLVVLLENLHVPKIDQMQQAQRIFHGRGHAYQYLNHISIDWFIPVLHITLFAPVSEGDIAQLATALLKYFGDCQSIQIQHRYRQDWKIDTIYGEPVKHLEIIEGNRRFLLEFKTGANTGLFLDMKNGRNWVQNHSKYKRILNLFSYTCGFSIAAIEGGADFVFNIDMKSSFLSIGRNNHRLNNHNLDSIRFEKLNIMKSFGRIENQAPYDLIICDPPTFQKGSFNIARDYPKLLKRLHPFLNNNGQMMLCINTPHIGSMTGREFLLQNVIDHAPELTYKKDIRTPNVFIDIQEKGMKSLIFNLKDTPPAFSEFSSSRPGFYKHLMGNTR